MFATGGMGYEERFNRMADVTQNAADRLHQMLLQLQKADCAEQIRLMKNDMKQCRVEQAEITRRLARDFLPPVDREDLFGVTVRLCYIVEALSAIMHRFYWYRLPSCKPEAAALAQKLMPCSVELKKAIQNLFHFKQFEEVSRYVEKLRAAVRDGEADTSACRRSLFLHVQGTLPLYEWEQIYEAFYRGFAAFGAAGETLLYIALKHK